MESKKASNPKTYKLLNAGINRVFNCEEPDLILNTMSIPEFKTGKSIEMILKILKWLFAEQDVTYWNYTGRHMLKKALDQIA